MRIVVLVFMLLILISLGSAMLLLMRDRGTGSDRMVKALAWRVGLSISLFLILMIGFATGLIDGKLS